MNSPLNLICDFAKTCPMSLNFFKDSIFYFIPEFKEASKCVQKYNQTVLSHTIDVINNLEIKNNTTILSAMFHDIGKINTKKTLKKPNEWSFYGHSEESVKIAKKYFNIFNIDVITKDKVCSIIETHMLDIVNNMSDRSLNNFICRVNPDNILNWIVIRKADIKSYGDADKFLSNKFYPFCERVYKFLIKNYASTYINFGNESNDIPVIIGE